MKAIKTVLAFILVAMFAIVGAQAAPINVTGLDVEDNNGNYMALVTLANGATGEEYTELSFEIDGQSTQGQVVKVPNNTSSQTEAYDLQEVLDNYDDLKRGETYTLGVSTEDNSSMETSFLFKTAKTTDGLPVIIEEVQVNSVEVADDDVLQVQNGENVQVELQLFAQQNIEDARFRIFIEGYEHDTILASSDIFSVKDGKTYVKTLDVQLPSDMDSQDEYKLRIEGANDLSGLTYKEYSLYVDTQRHRVDVLDLVTTPSSGVEPGQNVISNVRLKNRGQQSQDSVKATVSVPELGISESSYVSNLDTDEVATSDDILMLVPESAKAGQYEAKVELTYNDGYSTTVENYTFTVLAPKVAKEKNLLVSYNNNVELRADETTTFDVVIANPNQESKPISLAASDNAWANVEISPSLSMVSGGEDATYTVKVTPKSSVSGEKQLSFTVKEGTNVEETFSMNTYVEGQDSNLANILLAVLIVIAIIILITLIVMIARKKNDTSEDFSEDFESEEYY